MRTQPAFLLASLLTLLLAACGRGPEEAPAPVDAPSAAPAPAPDTKLQGQKGLLSGNLDALPTCAVSTTLTLDWNIGGSPATESVKLYVGDGPEAKLFAAGGASGNAKTGPWVSPGAIFVLRNGTDEAELDRVVIPGAACP